MGVVVNVFLDFEHFLQLLEHHAKHDVEVFSRRCSRFVEATVDGILRVVCVFHPTTFIFFISVDVDAFGDEAFVEFVEEEEFSGKVDHRASFAAFVNHKQRRNSGSASHESVVGTESRCDVHNTGTILGSNVVAGDYAESLVGGNVPVAGVVGLNGLNPGEELLVLHSDEVGADIFADDAERNQLVAGFVVFESDSFGFLVEVVVEQLTSKDNGYRFAVVAVVAFDGNVFDFWANAERRVAGKRPRSCSPSQEVGCAPVSHFRLGVLDFELRNAGGVFDVAVATRLVQFVRTQTGACGGRVGLDGVSFVEVALAVKVA